MVSNSKSVCCSPASPRSDSTGGLGKPGDASQDFGNARETFGGAWETFAGAWENFGNAWEMFGNPREMFGNPRETFARAAEILKNSPETSGKRYFPPSSSLRSRRNHKAFYEAGSCQETSSGLIVHPSIRVSAN
jgi:hypothetical protein